MSSIEKYLHEHFASVQDEDEPAAAPSNPMRTLRDSVPETLDEPFAKVNSVVAGSPAETAGLKAGDLIRNFGYVNKGNHDNLKKVAECVQGNEGVSQQPQRPTSSPISAAQYVVDVWRKAMRISDAFMDLAETSSSKTSLSRCLEVVAQVRRRSYV
jgi:C-terminal processing protease CtpA/Prc